ncbi:MAG: AAA family ATPase [Oscillospiraceae bacterium]|jgi:MoxR-like ATPase
MEFTEIRPIADKLKRNIAKVIIGKDEIIEHVLTALFASGHILLEDMPGTGKTTLAKVLAKSVSCQCNRIQFTPDLLPSDLTGINFYNQKQGDFVFRQGPLFTNVLLADEINRATPRTQSSLLESMEEGQVTVDSVTYRLEQPFLVIATQNPVETQGTFPLPEAQMDRFMMRLSVGYPDRDFEIGMLGRFVSENPLDRLEPVITGEEVVAVQQAVRSVLLSEDVKAYLVDVCAATRTHPNVRLGVSPRGSLALMRAAQSRAALSGRDFVTPEDIKALAPHVLAHRILCRTGASLRDRDSGLRVVEEVLASVPVPTEL